MAHWKHTATRCAVEGCEAQRVKGWSTCRLIDHHAVGKSLYGAGRIAPIPVEVVQLSAINRKLARNFNALLEAN